LAKFGHYRRRAGHVKGKAVDIFEDFLQYFANGVVILPLSKKRLRVKVMSALPKEAIQIIF
jgi:hypothetical protein